jgi:lipoprotein-anchoring transpeptidase ErfK/SrfK
MPPPRLILSPIAAVIAVGLLLSGCAQQAPPAAPTHFVAAPARTPTPTSTPSSPAPVGIAATATGSSVAVYDQPGGTVTETLANPIPAGAPLTFLVSARQTGWIQVQLAQRPNGSTGWVDSGSVQLTTLSYSLHVSTQANTLTLAQYGKPVQTFPVATGTGGTPTPHGSFYLTELLAPRNSGYGPYAFGLSAFSTVLNSFGGGPGQIGLHGTDDQSSIGTAASHGCIRMQNTDITTLAHLLPLGTPIAID